MCFGLLPQFLTQPFVVGERVTLLNGGSKVVTGFVESINPLSTIIRDDDGVPITIPNVVSSPLPVVPLSQLIMWVKFKVIGAIDFREYMIWAGQGLGHSGCMPCGRCNWSLKPVRAQVQR